jgi:hypothetical protein
MVKGAIEVHDVYGWKAGLGQEQVLEQGNKELELPV